jgi:hypothetical protein
MRHRNRILLATAAALVAGAIAYTNPASSMIEGAARDEAAAAKSFRVLGSGVSLDWDQAAIAHAVLSIVQ